VLREERVHVGQGRERRAERRDVKAWQEVGRDRDGGRLIPWREMRRRADPFQEQRTRGDVRIDEFDRSAAVMPRDECCGLEFGLA
jgi:hypothetical protein